MTQLRAPQLEPFAFACHELRAPLGVIATAARILAAGHPGDPDLAGQCQRIERSAERLMRTSRSVILASLGGAADAGPGSARDAFVRALQDIEQLGISVVGVLPEPGVLVACATDVLESLVSSLLLNASDHADLSHPLELFASHDSAYLHVVFRNRVRADKHHAGYGLGTLILQCLAQAAGARISAESHEDWFLTAVSVPLD
ncbi:MAG: HAMP domain-containing histidine kinase [Dehalococcoidia bacterium]|nr:HAMP domain-containing histidine kinase [Dehalococcoidia bacterium]